MEQDDFERQYYDTIAEQVYLVHEQGRAAEFLRENGWLVIPPEKISEFIGSYEIRKIPMTNMEEVPI